jgi:hypothetical protein
MKIPDVKLVERWLEEGYKRNPGPWVKHSKLVANAAKNIGEKIPDLNPNTVYIMGLIHDIGRNVGVTQDRHSIDGYNFLKSEGYEELGRICITHCFPNQNLHANVGVWDCSKEELNLIEIFLLSCQYDDYDRLIQLCDCISMEKQYVLIEKRLVDVVLRYNLKTQVPIGIPLLEKWKKYLELKDYFDKKIGKSIYTFLPNVVDNTFGFVLSNSK